MQTGKPLQFFLGANTPQGFVSRFDQLADPSDGWREWVIKGGPGTGKSTLMKQVSTMANKHPGLVEEIHCSSDVDSLDGVILHGAKASIADGTLPHAIEPKYPGAFERLVDLTNCWDENRLFAQREEIMAISAKISKCHEHCCRFLSAANTLLGDNYRMALEATWVAKAARAAGRIAATEFKGSHEKYGKESVRFLSAVTNQGLTLFSETANILCQRIYLLDDPYGAASRLILNLLRAKALEEGFDIYTCYSPLSPYEKIEHLFIPELKLGFMTKNDLLDPQITPYKVIRFRRFTDQEMLRKFKRRLSFNRKAALQMLEAAARLLSEAKSMHDQLESYYIQAMDFSKAGKVTKQVVSTIEACF